MTKTMEMNRRWNEKDCIRIYILRSVFSLVQKTNVANGGFLCSFFEILRTNLHIKI